MRLLHGERKRARHARRASRRAVLKRVGVGTFALAANLVIPRMIHSEIVKPAGHPTWDRVLNHVSRQTIGLHALDRRPELNDWVHGLVLRPKQPQPALLLIGPECSGKTTFRQAMGLLLPPQGIVQYPDEARLLHWQTLGNRTTAWEERLRQAWLAVTQDEPARYVRLFRHPEKRDGRYLKWCLTHTHDVDPLPKVQRFDVGLLATTVPKADLLKRLEDEREAFQRTLTKYRAAA